MTLDRGVSIMRVGRGPSIALLCLVLLLSACGRRNDDLAAEVASTVQLATVQAWDAREVREFFGRVEQTVISPLAFEVSGRVVEIAVRDGARVKRGQLIARLDAEPYELQLRRADAQYRQLAADLVRKRQLRDERILSQGAFEQLEAATAMAKVQAELARRDLRNSRLTAPFDGRISMRSIEPQQVVQAGMPVFQLENQGRLDIGVDLPQNLAQRMTFDKSLGAEAWLPERSDLRFPLIYREHATQSAPSSGVYRLIFSGESPAGVSLLAGMAVRVRIVQGDIQQDTTAAFAVPLAALNVLGDGKFQVWRQDPKDGRVQSVPVSVRELKGDQALVSGDLQAGEQVVATGSRFLHEGQKVTGMGDR